MQTFFVKYKVKDNSQRSIHEWADFLNKHQKQVLESLRDEKVIFESVALDEQSDGLYLIYVMKAKDVNETFKIFENSKHEIDIFHKKFFQEVLEKPQKLQILVDFENSDFLQA